VEEEGEIMEVDILFVGGGITCLSRALHLSNLIKEHNKKVEQEGKGKRLDEVMIAILEKGTDIGSHNISGAIMDPVALKDSPTDEQRGVIKFDGKKTFDKESDVYYSGTIHEEQQPAHLKIPDLNICFAKCREEYQNPCTRFCPANVYEIEIDGETGKPTMRLNFSNCLHCKTCDIKDPYENITWVPPEGGGGPKYTIMWKSDF
jgi:electron-transferring-flavoprotein dehydrogenase